MKNQVVLEMPGLKLNLRYEEGKTADSEKNFRKALRAEGYGNNFVNNLELKWQAPEFNRTTGKTTLCMAYILYGDKHEGTLKVINI